MFERKHLLLIISDINDEKFGIYLHSEIQKKFYSYQLIDNKSFHFNLESNGRLSKPMKFEIVNSKNGGIQLKRSSSCELIELGDITLWWNNKNKTLYSSNFNYHEVGKALFDFDHRERFTFVCFQRFIVIQMD